MAVTSAQENNFIVGFLGETGNVWSGGHGSGNVYEWDGGDPWGFTAFRQPFTAPSSHECIEIFNDGKWAMYTCASLPWSICEAEVDTQQ